MKYNHAGHAKPKDELGDRYKLNIAVFKAICLQDYESMMSGSKPILSLGPIMWLLTDKQSQTRRKTRGAGNMQYNHAGQAQG